MGNTLQPWSSH